MKDVYPAKNGVSVQKLIIMSLVKLKCLLAGRLNFRKKVLLFFVVKMGISTFVKKITSIVRNIRLSATFHRCATTKLFRFEKALSGELSYLKKSRFFIFADTKTALTAIFEEFCIETANLEYQNTLNEYKKLAKLYGKIIELEYYIKYFPENTREIRRLSSVDNIKAAEGVLKLLKKQYSDAIKKVEKSQKTDKKQLKTSGFDDLKAEITKYMGFRVDSKEVTVSEFISWLKKYKEEFESQKKQLEKHGKQ